MKRLSRSPSGPSTSERRRASAAGVLGVALMLAGPGARADMSAGVAAVERGDYEAARRELRLEADAGNPRARAMLGDLYRRGLGVQRNYGIASRWYHLAADGGDPHAQYELARLYREGLGVPRSPVQAVVWLRAAAQQGQAEAQADLAAAYLRGEGVAPDPVLAYAWMSRAAAQGDVAARQACRRLARTLSPAQRARAEELARARLR